MAKKRLEASNTEQSLSAAKRDFLITRAEEDLELAKERLDVEKSDDLEQIGKEAERELAQKRLAVDQGEVNWANMCLERLDTLLEWIAGQFTEIATEYASSSSRSQHRRDIIVGWEVYYVYMCQRLHAKQEQDVEWLQIRKQTEAEDARDDLRFPQERIRPLKALLAWIEREFPEIAVKYTPLSKDSSSNGDKKDQAQVQAQTLPLYSKLSPSESAYKASRSGIGKSIRHKGESAIERSLLSLAQPLKVSKPGQRRRRPLNQKLSTSHNGIRLLEGHASDIRQGSSMSAVRRK